jgi:hypothetical protein
MLGEALEKKLEHYRQDAALRLQEMLVQERKRSDSLLSGYSKLNQKYWALQWLRDKEKKKGSPLTVAEEVDVDFGDGEEEQDTGRPVISAR